MLGDIGLKTRGWGNVSVENNHIDVFVFEFADVLRWLSNEYKESRFSNFAEVISPLCGSYCLMKDTCVALPKWVTIGSCSTYQLGLREEWQRIL